MNRKPYEPPRIRDHVGVEAAVIRLTNGTVRLEIELNEKRMRRNWEMARNRIVEFLIEGDAIAARRKLKRPRKRATR